MDSTCYVLFIFQFSFVVLILFIMQLYDRLKRGKFVGQPPNTFFRDNDTNREMIAAAFGVVSLDIMLMIRTDYKTPCRNIGQPEYFICEFFSIAIICVLAAFMTYPMFALISSHHVLLSSVFGVAFVVWNIVQHAVQINVTCVPTNFEMKAAALPIFVFLAFLLIAFCYRLYMCWKTGVHTLPNRAASVVRKHQVMHLKNLMKRQDDAEAQQGGLAGCFTRAKNVFKPWYVFPGEIMYCMIVIIAITYYQFINKYTLLVKFIHVMPVKDYVVYSACVLTVIIYGFGLVQFLYHVQQDTFSIYRGRQKFFENDDGHHNLTVYRSMVFPGYFIGIMSFGFVLTFVFTIFVVVVINFIVNGGYVWLSIRVLLSFIGVRLAFSYMQRLVVRYALTDRTLSKLAVNVKHPHAYSMMSFYMLFMNAFHGFSGGIKRTLLVLVTLFVFNGRIDRNPMMFFTSFDASSFYYGYLRFQSCFKNPVMRCFCQILLEPSAGHIDHLTTQQATRTVWGKLNQATWNVEFTARVTSENGIRSKVARNRWHLAYTLTRNPALIQYRCIGSVPMYRWSK